MSTAKLLCQLQASVCCWPRPVTWLLGQLLPSGLGSASGPQGGAGAGRQEEGDVFACCSCLRCSSNTAAKPRQLFQSPLLSATPEAALGHPPGVPAQRSKPSSMGMRLKF